MVSRNLWAVQNPISNGWKLFHSSVSASVLSLSSCRFERHVLVRDLSLPQSLADVHRQALSLFPLSMIERRFFIVAPRQRRSSNSSSSSSYQRSTINRESSDSRWTEWSSKKLPLWVSFVGFLHNEDIFSSSSSHLTIGIEEESGGKAQAEGEEEASSFCADLKGRNKLRNREERGDELQCPVEMNRENGKVKRTEELWKSSQHAGVE
ncbi:unnamed protein product [Linum trigynum]|uniref:Uncharacterized protein n=1 Tax=Linum trigynum TaxID=586398 RepID=A0AAV2FBP5_9ROSI